MRHIVHSGDFRSRRIFGTSLLLPKRQSAAKLLSKDEASRFAVTSPRCRSFFKVLNLRPRSKEEFCDANDDENDLSDFLYRRSRG